MATDEVVVAEEHCVSSLVALSDEHHLAQELSIDLPVNNYIRILHSAIPPKSFYLDDVELFSNLDGSLLSLTYPQEITNRSQLPSTNNNSASEFPTCSIQIQQQSSKPQPYSSKTKLKVDPVLLSARPRPALATIDPNIPRQTAHKDLEKILAQKIESRGDSSNIDLWEFYKTLQETKGKRLHEIYLILYDVLHVNVRKDSDNIKMIRNNINFKIKNMLESYPHLRFYGEAKDFNLTRLHAVPEVLLTIADEGLRDKFQATPVGRSAMKIL